ncbi:MAG: fumarate hydratase [Methanomicrobiales archaeon]|nr:fumarate hydratase [Methanomicrobiales archaeon]
MPEPDDPPLLEAITGATCRALLQAERVLPDDVINAIRRARQAETTPIAREQLDRILENITLARESSVPLCQDTGVPVIYLTLPADVPFTRGILDALADGVRRATGAVPLRPNIVDPLTRENTLDNTGPGMPAVHVRPGEYLEITVLPKGAGAENLSRIGMLLPAETDRIEAFVAETMLIAGSRPCPPVVLGVGIGSTFDGAAALAKEALLLPIDTMNPFEEQLCGAVNRLGIGPMGLGGKVTALAVKVKKAHCHTATLPVAVNVQCWACRRATVRVEYRS